MYLYGGVSQVTDLLTMVGFDSEELTTYLAELRVKLPQSHLTLL